MCILVFEYLASFNQRFKNTEIDLSPTNIMISPIEAFNKALENCETAEGRDKLREVQVYINTTKAETKYDNTAFIAGLAEVITGGRFNGMEKLKQINPKLFTPTERKSRNIDDDPYENVVWL
ncbi:MAG: hypothetical protein IKS39_11245 [Clostridia bacterium]|nr:hypothetical protein [Clostridia bacterium]